MRLSGWLFLLSLGGPTPRPAAPLPTVVLAPAAPRSGTLAILITGDGGWSITDRTIAERLASEGDGVIGLNSEHYFAHTRTPAEVAADLDTLAHEGCARWSCERIVLIGYSMGADVLPFAIDELSSDVRPLVVQVQLIGPGHRAGFHFLPIQWLGIRFGRTYPTLPQLAKLHDVDVVCIFGTLDRDAVCRDLAPGQATVIPVASGHIMSKVAGELAGLVSEQIRRVRSTGDPQAEPLASAW